MKKRLIMAFMVGVMTLTSALPAFEAPKHIGSGKDFDTKYVSGNNQKVETVHAERCFGVYR